MRALLDDARLGRGLGLRPDASARSNLPPCPAGCATRLQAPGISCAAASRPPRPHPVSGAGWSTATTEAGGSHLVDALPAGDSTEERRAGALWLMTLRTGHTSYGAYDRYAGVVLDMVAWQAGERSPDEHQVHDWRMPTFQLLLALQQDHTSHGVLPDRLRQPTMRCGALRTEALDAHATMR